MSEYTRTAQALAHNIDDDAPEGARRSESSSPVYNRRSLSSGRRSLSQPKFRNRYLNDSYELSIRAQKKFNSFSLLQQVLLVLGSVTLLVLGILFLVFNERIFGAMAPVAKKWRNMKGGWCILWAATFIVGFPPLIGYSSAVTLAGFVFGVPKGWLIAASATVIGSTASFIVSRTVLKGYVSRLTANDTRFAALALVLQHDGLKILIMIRLCPLPYSLSNGAVSTIPTVTWSQFILASTLASPKLLLHVFVGSRLGAIAESGDKMDLHTKIISYLSIAIGLTAGIVTGWFMYTKTKARAAQLEADEGENALRGEEGDEELDDEGQLQYSDDPIERSAAHALARGQDGYSLHGHGQYRDSFSDDDDDAEDADEFQDDPFLHGDGDEEEGFRESAKHADK
ncbi:hypothetical protein BDV97DRAFT_398088 [Delphinella strobiligena]|nr:hypothetical protein BDV97DRAFT_398088 [Delphinella strobiligena]